MNQSGFHGMTAKGFGSAPIAIGPCHFVRLLPRSPSASETVFPKKTTMTTILATMIMKKVKKVNDEVGIFLGRCV